MESLVTPKKQITAEIQKTKRNKMNRNWGSYLCFEFNREIARLWNLPQWYDFTFKNFFVFLNLIFE